MEDSWGGWVGGGGVGGDGMGHMVGLVMGWVGGGGGISEWVAGGGVGVVGGPHDTPHHGGHQMPPMLFFDNLVKKLDQIVKK